MAAPRQMLTLDVSRRNSARQTLYLGEGDVRGTTLVVSLTEAGRPFDCDAYTPYLMIPVSHSAMYRVGGTVSGNIATFVVDESGLGNVNGTMPGAYVSLENDDGSMTSTQRFNVIVIESMRDAPRPDQFTTDVEMLIERIDELERRINETSALDDRDIDDTLSDGTSSDGTTDEEDTDNGSD